jgi:hypothetical protein
METKRTRIETPVIDIATITLDIKGITPLLMEKFSDKTLKKLMDRDTGKGTERKVVRDFKKEAEDKIHTMTDGKPGFPATAFKRAMVEAAPYLEGMDKKRAKGSFFVLGDLVRINCRKQDTLQSVCKQSGATGAPMIVWRPQFWDWACKLIIRFNSKQISPDQIVSLARLAGFHIGIGGWRPQCNGQYGMFDIKEDRRA